MSLLDDRSDHHESAPAATVATPRRPVIVKGRREPLSSVPFHADGPLARWLMASRALDPRMGFYVTVHAFSDVEPARRAYCRPHVHDYDELNVFHTTSELRVEVQLDDDTIVVDAPATVLIPAGTRHAANVLSGSGFLVVILQDGEFRATAGASRAPSPP